MNLRSYFYLCGHLLLLRIYVLGYDDATELLHLATADGILAGRVEASYQHVGLLLLSIKII